MSLKNYHNEIKVVVFALGIFGSYSLYGYYQEAILTARYGPDKETFDFALFLVFYQCIINALCAVVIRLVLADPPNATPYRAFLQMGFTYIAAMFSSNEALKYVDYPTQVLAKSCKPIPVLVIGVLIYQKRHPWSKVFFVFLITLGITIFMGLKSGKKGHGAEESATSVLGIVLLAVSLFFDGFTGNYQETIIKKHQTTTHQLMLYINIAAVVILVLPLLITGQGLAATDFCVRHPAVVWQMTLFSLASGAGQNFVFLLLSNSGALALTITTTCRKFFTILLSVVAFGHTLSPAQWLGVGLVFSGLGGEVVESQQRKRRAAEKDNEDPRRVPDVYEISATGASEAASGGGGGGVKGAARGRSAKAS